MAKTYTLSEADFLTISGQAKRINQALESGEDIRDEAQKAHKLICDALNRAESSN